MTKPGPIKDAIDSINEVLNKHENHLYPADEDALRLALARLVLMSQQGFV